MPLGVRADLDPGGVERTHLVLVDDPRPRRIGMRLPEQAGEDEDRGGRLQLGEERNERLRVVREPVVERQRRKRGARARAHLRGKPSERHELVAPAAEALDVAPKVVRPDEEPVGVASRGDVGDPVVGERERRQRGHRVIVFRDAASLHCDAMERNDRPTVSAVIITRDRRAALEVVLARLATEPVDEVVVVDNGSSDGTPEAARALGVTVVEAGENLGVGARNLGARAARGDLVLMLDDDAYPCPAAVETLRAAFDVCPDSASRAGSSGTWTVRAPSCARPRSGRSTGGCGPDARANPRTGFRPSPSPRAPRMVRRDAYLDAGGFFEPYFLGSSEVDLAARLLARGWDVRYLPGAAFDHLKAPGGRDPDDVLYYRIRNHLWYLWLRYPRSVAVRRAAGYLAFDLVDAAHRRVPGAWWRAVRDAWRLRSTVRPERAPLPREVIRRAELNRGRMHARFLGAQARRRLRRR